MTVNPKPAAYLLSLVFTFQAVAQQPFDESFAAREMQRAINDPDTRVSLKVTASQQQVFDALLKQVDRYTEDAVKVSFDHSGSEQTPRLGVGSIRRTEMKNGDLLYQRIIQLDEPSSFSYFTDMTLSTVNVPLDYTVGHYTVKQTSSSGVKATVSVAYQTSSVLTGFIVRRVFNRAVQQDFAKAEKYLNAEASGLQPR
jgi:hypothetical protein